jgi:16S rRNA (cytosine1402-N4)-methyltransferase
MVLTATGNYEEAYLVDRDKNAQVVLSGLFGAQGCKLLHTDFLEASKSLVEEGKKFDVILADLGVSSPHLDNKERGFSFKSPAPLDMRMDQRAELTAAKIVNEYDETELADIIYEYGEEPKSRLIARKIVEARPIDDTANLAEVVASAYRGWSKRHPATKTFQALRIVVNNELGLLSEALPLWLKLLSPGGRLAVITFHSLEDRIVKNAFKSVCEPGYESEFIDLTKHPIVADKNELVSNPRARSAKLRAVVKIKTKERE